MPENILLTYLILLPTIFIAGFVDSIAGGGGLISVPAYFAAGLPPHYALGTNKFSSCFGTLFATAKYWKGGIIDTRVALLSAAFALPASWAGSSAVLAVRPDFLRYLLLVLIPLLAAFTYLKKDFGSIDQSHLVTGRGRYLLAASFSTLIGFYDGFFGPGTGTFLIICFSYFLRYDLRLANGNTKVVNLASNIAALVTFVFKGKVLLLFGLPAVAAGIAGNVAGANFALKKGNRFIRVMVTVVLSILLVKILFDVLKN
jgi:hypothetical protein